MSQMRKPVRTDRQSSVKVIEVEFVESPNIIFSNKSSKGGDNGDN